MFNEVTQQDPLFDFKERFKPIRDKWRQLRLKTGQILLDAKNSLGGLFKIFRKWVSTEIGINESDQKVCMRIALGEVSPEVAARLPSSKLCKIHNDNMPKMDTIYRIYSPTTGKIMEKKFRDFDHQELRECVSVHGVTDASEMVVDKEKPYATCIAQGYRVENGYLILTVQSIRKDVRIRLSTDLAASVSNGFATGVA